MTDLHRNCQPSRRNYKRLETQLQPPARNLRTGKERESQKTHHPLHLIDQYCPLPSPLSKTISGSLFDQTKLARGPPTLLFRFSA